ncbi:stress responsive alpha/beta barrel protein [Actinoplanes lutulentus]|uniref:Stress responsive alpha/beta barrel protein n=1 Tax=Actinoplanes lutulentus TaxID=1287878 RepID=A0A327ZMR6_9ACTN|nr:stress responsive alpha/beta barrel protein [Actinoplanes lutulentus]
MVHIVLMKFADAGDAAKATLRLEELAGVVPEIRAVEVHLDELNTGVSWDLYLKTTHLDADDLRAYQAHPAHLELGAWLRPLLTSRAVVDYTEA